MRLKINRKAVTIFYLGLSLRHPHYGCLYSVLKFYTLGRLFFHYSHFNGNSNDLRLHDEVEFEVIIDRDNRKVATRVMKLKKGTINFESFSPERVNGEVASPPSGNHPGSLSYNSTGEFFFLPFGANDISSACQLYKGLPFGIR